MSLRELQKRGHIDIQFQRRDEIEKHRGKETPAGIGLTDHDHHILE